VGAPPPARQQRWLRPRHILTEIYLCDTCSCQEIDASLSLSLSLSVCLSLAARLCCDLLAAGQSLRVPCAEAAVNACVCGVHVAAGLLRVRGFTQDDAHIFCTEAQAPAEIASVLSLTTRFLETFGFAGRFEAMLSTRPAGEGATVGSDGARCPFCPPPSLQAVRFDWDSPSAMPALVTQLRFPAHAGFASRLGPRDGEPAQRPGRAEHPLHRGRRGGGVLRPQD
jgi:hypothetical protein